MENFEEKWEKNLFWSVFGWVERKENKWWGLDIFFLDQPKNFLSKMEKKLKGENKTA